MLNMAQQIQKLQQQANKLQAELEEMTLTGTAGGGIVEVDVSGQTRFKTIRIKAEAINPDNPESVSEETIELLEDLVESAIRDASKKAAKIAKEKMEAITSALAGASTGGFPAPPKPKAPEGEKPKDDDFGGIGGFGNLLG